MEKMLTMVESRFGKNTIKIFENPPIFTFKTLNNEKGAHYEQNRDEEQQNAEKSVAITISSTVERRARKNYVARKSIPKNFAPNIAVMNKPRNYIAHGNVGKYPRNFQVAIIKTPLNCESRGSVANSMEQQESEGEMSNIDFGCKILATKTNVIWILEELGHIMKPWGQGLRRGRECYVPIYLCKVNKS